MLLHHKRTCHANGVEKCARQYHGSLSGRAAEEQDKGIHWAAASGEREHCGPAGGCPECVQSRGKEVRHTHWALYPAGTMFKPFSWSFKYKSGQHNWASNVSVPKGSLALNYIVAALTYTTYTSLLNSGVSAYILGWTTCLCPATCQTSSRLKLSPAWARVTQCGAHWAPVYCGEWLLWWNACIHLCLVSNLLCICHSKETVPAPSH